MKKLFSVGVLFVLALVAGQQAQAGYFHLIDPNHPQIGAGFLIAPKRPLDTTGILSLALVTHSVADGSIIPESWQSIIPPESWTPFAVCFGGSFNGDATICIDTSANAAPILGANLLRWVDESSSPFMQAVKRQLIGQGAGAVRLGGALAGKIRQDGRWQSLSVAFPGRGFWEILGNAARAEVGYAWKF